MRLVVSLFLFLIVGVYGALIFESCCNKKAIPIAAHVNYAPGIINQVVAHDTVCIGGKDDPELYTAMYDYLRDSMRHSYDSITHANEVLGRKLLLAQFKLKEIDKYVKICDNNPSQNKYLRGWVKRALK